MTEEQFIDELFNCMKEIGNEGAFDFADYIEQEIKKED